MLMEKDPNPMPHIDLFPRLGKLAHFLFDHITSPGLSDHANRGGGPALDRALFDDVQVEGFLYTGEPEHGTLPE